jgi:hydrogenase/urease accessory protein HupE
VTWLFIAAAWAHQTGMSYARFSEDSLTLVFAEEELAAVAPVDDLDAARILLRELTLDAVRVEAGGAPCAFGEPRFERTEGDGIAVQAPLDCPNGDTWTYRAGFLPTLVAGHRHVVERDGAALAVLEADRPEARLTPSERGSDGTREVATRFLLLGVEHIWTGYDHLVFLFALLLASARFRDMLGIVTGFTVAHSVTLSASVLGWVVVPAWVVEPAIAASIVYVGVENLARPSARRRLAVTALLGLVHGFGFAGMLAELGLPSEARMLALACFNGGVELGQAAVVLIALPALLRLRRLPVWEKRGVPTLSVGVASLGLGWFVSRVLGAG